MASLTIRSMIISYTLILSLFNFEFSNAAVKGGYWSPYNAINASDIDSTHFTHLFCAFANLDLQNYNLTTSPECKAFPQVIKRKNPSVEAVLSVGGGKAQSSDYNTMASQPTTRKVFIDSSISLATSNGYDGLDLDWEQQTNMGEMENMATLLTEWRAAIKAQAPNLILTAALHYKPMVKADVFTTNVISSISTNLDWVNVMAYDFYGPGYGPPPTFTHPHAALYDPTAANVSGSKGIDAWIKAGVPANKLVLGVPFYGHAWELVSPSDHGIFAHATSNNNILGGVPTYTEIKKFISQTGATVVYNSSYVANYCYSGTTWIAYDEPQAIQAKVAYAKKTALNGYIAWRIDQDDNWALSKQASQTWGS